MAIRASVQPCIGVVAGLLSATLLNPAVDLDWVDLPLVVICLALLVMDLDEDFLPMAGWTIIFAEFGVSLVVQYHLPLARAHDWPSLAVPYSAVAETELPKGSSNLT